MVFHRKFHRENRGPSNSLKDDSMAEIERFKWATIPRFSPHVFLPTNFLPFLKELNRENLENT